MNSNPNMSMSSRLRRSAWTVPLCALAAVSVLAFNELAYFQSRNDLSVLTERGTARLEMHQLLRLLVDAETGQRGFLLTGRTEYLRPYQEADAEIHRLVNRLEARFFSGHPLFETFRSLVRLTYEKRSELQTTIALYQQGRHEAWQQLTMTDIGREKMDEIRRLVNQLLLAENAAIAKDRQALNDNFLVNRLGIASLTVLGLLGLVLLLRQTRALDALALEHAQDLTQERDRFEAQVLERTAELTQLTKHLQTVREDEKSHLGRELHDEMGALLTAAKLDIARLKRSLEPLVPEVANRLGHLTATINSGIGLKRRIIEDLRPSSLSNLGLLPALQIQVREFATRTGLEVVADLQDAHLPKDDEIVAYRFVQEALTNIVKHASASKIAVTFKPVGDEAYLAVQDNGVGMVPGGSPRSVHGLLGMRYRVEAVHGRMAVTSESGQGTRLEAWLPLRRSVDDPGPPA